MLKRIVFGLFIVFAVSVSASFAQGVYTPEKGSAERTAIMNALRVPVEKELKQKIQFAVQDFKVQGNWAFLGGTPQNMAGGEPNYKNTVHQESIVNGMFDNNFSALLKKTSGKWKVVTYAIGCTDVCYVMWWKEHKAPKTIFPYTE